MSDAYTEGVNAFLDTTTAVPIEYAITGTAPEPWQSWDCFAVYKVRHLFMGVFEGKLWRAQLVNSLGPEKAADLLRGYQPGHLIISPPGAAYDGPVLSGLEALTEGLEAVRCLKADPDAGSNSWAVHGSRTATGKPLLAGDSHRALDTPNVYYQNHIACPEFDVIGLSFPGCPGFPHFGHNPHVAWCVTHAQADYQDLYVERFSPDDPTKYEFEGEWKPAEVRRESILVKGGQPVEIEVTSTHHGPIIGGTPENGFGIAFRYTATAEANLGFESFLEMMNAASGDDIDAAMEKWVDPCNNFLYADVHGNIGYLNRGQVPIRSMANAWLPVPGWTALHEWQGNIPFEDLCRMRNPDPGVIVTANNRIVGNEYPYYIGLNYVPEYRARRVYDRLSDLSEASVEDMRAIQADRVSLPSRVLAGIIKGLEPRDETIGSAKQILEEWDGSMERDAVAPTIYSAFRIKLLRKIVGRLAGPLADEMFTSTGRGASRHLNELASLLVTMARDGDTSLLEPGSDWRSVSAEALSDAVEYLKRRLGEDMEKWQWGRVHHTAPKHTLSGVNPGLSHVLDPPSMPMGGDGDTPQMGNYSLGNPFAMTLMSVVRYVYDTANWENSRWAVPLGVSGHPASPHYADQAPVWADVDLVPMHYNWDRIKADAQSHQIISPL
jgi:penicillin amidase